MKKERYTMLKEQMLRKLTDLARQRYAYICDDDYQDGDYYDEIQEIIDEWNSLVPVAQELGISHSDMKQIWNRSLRCE